MISAFLALTHKHIYGAFIYLFVCLFISHIFELLNMFSQKKNHPAICHIRKTEKHWGTILQWQFEWVLEQSSDLAFTPVKFWDDLISWWDTNMDLHKDSRGETIPGVRNIDLFLLFMWYQVWMSPSHICLRMPSSLFCKHDKVQCKVGSRLLYAGIEPCVGCLIYPIAE